MTTSAHSQITVTLDQDVFERLQSLTPTPLLDDINSVLRRLLAAVDSPAGGSPRRVANLARGATLPVGLRLRATYRGKHVEAVVTTDGIEYGGVAYDSPSAAARAVKQEHGASETTSHSNGWNFWSYVDPASGESLPLEKLRPGERRWLRSLGAGASGYSDTSVLAGEIGMGPPPA